MDRKAKVTRARLLPRLEARFSSLASPPELALFWTRLEAHFADLFERLLPLYGEQYDFYYHLEEILVTAGKSWLARSPELKAHDRAREADPRWYQDQAMLGGVCYVDRFAGTLAGVREKIPYFQELGLSYLHLMPLFRSPAEKNDGGYAVSSYREVDPSLGTTEELQDLATELRSHGISLVLDFVFNHTSDEHEWALQALSGDPVYQDYYYTFPDRQMPNAYDATLREIFPEGRLGSFTYRTEIDRWVWTTFNSFQWDLNYANPEVFNRMAAEMFFLANLGVEVLRLDAVAFTWKKLGTSSENLPEAHLLIQAFNALARIAAPALIFKSEAIVHPDDVVAYISPEECQLSYNPLLMALLWEALATRDVRLLRLSMRERFVINPECAWVNYVRSHDDIGWTFSDDHAAALHINGFDHRQFLNQFYIGRFSGSFARGLPFQYNPKTQDARIAGTCASLAGLEKALAEETAHEVELALRRIILLHAVILSIGGIPLIYLGDEVGTLNDYGYLQDPAHQEDSRWVHRPQTDLDRMARRHDSETIEGRIYQSLRRLIEIRKTTAAFAVGETRVVDLSNKHVFGYLREAGGQRVLALFNFTEQEQRLEANELRLHGLTTETLDLVRGDRLPANTDLALAPYQFVWLCGE